MKRSQLDGQVRLPELLVRLPERRVGPQERGDRGDEENDAAARLDVGEPKQRPNEAHRNGAVRVNPGLVKWIVGVRHAGRWLRRCGAACRRSGEASAPGTAATPRASGSVPVSR